MNILLISELYPIKPEIKNDKTPKVLHHFAKEWAKMGHKIFVIRPEFLFVALLRGKKIWKEALYDCEGIPVLNLNFLFSCDSAINFDKRLNLKGFKPDIIVAHMPAGTMTATKFNKDKNLPIAVGIHQTNLRIIKDFIYQIYFSPNLKKAYDNADILAYRSPRIKEIFEKNYKVAHKKTCVACSGIDKNAIISKEIMLQKLNSWKTAGRVNFITVSSLIKRKNIDKIINALSQIKIKDWTLTIVGEGPQKKPLKKLTEKLNLKDKIIFTGNLYHQEVLDKLKSCDIFILPSKNETFGLVYLEAIASGCLVVGVENEGISGILKDNENGFLAGSSSTTSVKEKINELLLMDKASLSKIIDKMYEDIQVYTKENMAKAYLDEIITVAQQPLDKSLF